MLSDRPRIPMPLAPPTSETTSELPFGSPEQKPAAGTTMLVSPAITRSTPLPNEAPATIAKAPSPPIAPAAVQPAAPPASSAPIQILKRLVIPVATIATAAALIAFAIVEWDTWVSAAAVQTTDNATVRSDLTRLSARVSGNVRRVAVEEFQQVKAGDLLLEIDSADYHAAVAQAEAHVAASRAALDNLDNQKAFQRATITQAEAQRMSALARAVHMQHERARQDELLRGGLAGTRQRVERATADHDTAQATLAASEATIEAQRRQLNVLNGQQALLRANVQAAEAALTTARLRLSYTRIVAPVDGVVSERRVQEGDYVNVATNVIAVVPLPNVYVTANYKETQLTHVVPGQSVEVTVDSFPGAVLRGQVARLSPASGSTFALLPPDNATGNFTKVVQRIPVRVEFDPGQSLLEQLRPGMSVVSRIHIGSEPKRLAQMVASRGN
jgi:membrane fusion protein, multidrug efflux system